MNEVLQVIRNRRSIRRYLPKMVPEDTLKIVLEAANCAPSAHNKQSWMFLVVRGDSKAALSSLIYREAARFPRKVRVLMRLASQIIKSAPVVVAIYNTGELTREMGGDQSAEIENFFKLMEVQSSSAAVQNLMLAAASLGMGTVWLGAVYLIKEEITRTLASQGDLMAVVPLGYPATPSGNPPKKKPLDEVVLY